MSVSFDAHIDGILAANNYHGYQLPSDSIPQNIIVDADINDVAAAANVTFNNIYKPTNNTNSSSSSGSDSSGVHDADVPPDPDDPDAGSSLTFGQGVDQLPSFKLADKLVSKMASFWGFPDPTTPSNLIPLTNSSPLPSVHTLHTPNTPTNINSTQTTSSLSVLAPVSPAALSPFSMSLLHPRVSPSPFIANTSVANVNTTSTIGTAGVSSTNATTISMIGNQSQTQTTIPTPIATTATTTAAEEKNKKKSCSICHSHKSKCDGQRPCGRCSRLGRGAQCQDRVQGAPQIRTRRRTAAQRAAGVAPTYTASTLPQAPKHVNGAHQITTLAAGQPSHQQRPTLGIPAVPIVAIAAPLAVPVPILPRALAAPATPVGGIPLSAPLTALPLRPDVPECVDAAPVVCVDAMCQFNPPLTKQINPCGSDSPSSSSSQSPPPTTGSPVQQRKYRRTEPSILTPMTSNPLTPSPSTSLSLLPSSPVPAASQMTSSTITSYSSDMSAVRPQHAINAMDITQQSSLPSNDENNWIVTATTSSSSSSNTSSSSNSGHQNKRKATTLLGRDLVNAWMPSIPLILPPKTSLTFDESLVVRTALKKLVPWLRAHIAANFEASDFKFDTPQIQVCNQCINAFKYCTCPASYRVANKSLGWQECFSNSLLTAMWLKRDVVGVPSRELEAIPMATLCCTYAPMNGKSVSFQELIAQHYKMLGVMSPTSSVAAMAASMMSGVSPSTNQVFVLNPEGRKLMQDDLPMMKGPCPSFVFSMNTDLERLLGYTLDQMKARIQTTGWKIDIAFAHPDETVEMIQNMFLSIIGVKNRWSMRAHVVSRTGAIYECLIWGTMQLDNGFRTSTMCVVPLPGQSTPARSPPTSSAV